MADLPVHLEAEAGKEQHRQHSKEKSLDYPAPDAEGGLFHKGDTTPNKVPSCLTYYNPYQTNDQNAVTDEFSRPPDERHNNGHICQTDIEPWRDRLPDGQRPLWR